MEKSIIFILLKIILISTTVKSASIDNKISSVEADVIRLSREVENTFINRCKLSSSTKCLYLSCSSVTPASVCMNSFQTKACADCSDDTKGTMLNESPLIKLANVYQPGSDPDNREVRELTYSGFGLPKMFKSMHDNNKNFYKWMYYGNSAGSFQKYPGEKTCSRYDNRFRPWYIGAATGAKNFIMILDTSGSMQNYGKFEGLIEATKLLLKTLTNADWVGLVTFGTDVEYYNSNLVRATKENIDKLENYIDNLSAKGGTNFSDAFKITEEMIKNTKADENGVPCKTFIMFLTDGIPTEGITDETKLINYVESLPNLKSAILFTYAFGNSSGTEIPSKLACLFNGIFETIVYANEIVEKMNSYFFSLSLGIENKRPIWTEPYEDSAGLGIMTTCALPVYDRTSTPFLIGVVGIDIIMSDLYDLADEKTVKNKLITKSMQSCAKPNLSNCELNSVRKDGFTCELTEAEKKTGCSKVKNSIEYCPSLMDNVFCNKMEIVLKDEVKDLCCASCSSGSIAVVLGLIIGLVLLISIIVVIVLWKKGKICVPLNNANNRPEIPRQPVIQDPVNPVDPVVPPNDSGIAPPIV